MLSLFALGVLIGFTLATHIVMLAQRHRRIGIVRVCLP